MKIDMRTEYGQRVARRLQEERIIWLITVDEQERPQPRPVWFWWDGETILIYSRADTHKVRHIENNPQVALHFDGDGLGGDIVVLMGTAEIDSQAPPADEYPDYLAKYESGLRRIGMTPAEFTGVYTVAIRVRPGHMRGH